MPNFDCEKVDWDRLTPAGSSRAEGPIVLVGEASDLGWPPGKWPVYVTVENEEVLQGSRLFGPRESIKRRGNAVGYRYPQTNQTLGPVCEVHILND